MDGISDVKPLSRWIWSSGSKIKSYNLGVLGNVFIPA
jgi:hypothetical protein